MARLTKRGRRVLMASILLGAFLAGVSWSHTLANAGDRYTRIVWYQTSQRSQIHRVGVVRKCLVEDSADHLRLIDYGEHQMVIGCRHH